MSNKPATSPPPPGWRPDVITVPVNQPIPPGPGIDWWLRRMIARK
jgi:hypothetical protein